MVISDMQYEDRHDEEQPIECEMQGEDLNGRKFKMVKIKGLPPGFAKLNNFQSGFTTLFADGSDIDDATNELLIGEGTQIQVSERPAFHVAFYEVFPSSRTDSETNNIVHSLEIAGMETVMDLAT